jgi:hypothetical protein
VREELERAKTLTDMYSIVTVYRQVLPPILHEKIVLFADTGKFFALFSLP